MLGESRDEPQVQRLEMKVRRSKRVQALLSHENARRVAGTTRSVYYKWQGTHWMLASLADIGYPRADDVLRPLADRVLELWLRPSFQREVTVRSRERAGRAIGVARLRGRARRCASQQGNALRYLSILGLDDGRLGTLVRLLRRWQWPDGGWNCDKDPSADTSSFMETLLPMRGLAAYDRSYGDAAARVAAKRTSKVFLCRNLYRRRSDGRVILPDFVRLHHPPYYHYDVLGGLQGISEVGLIRDPRADECLDWLESRELPDGGWAADAR